MKFISFFIMIFIVAGCATMKPHEKPVVHTKSSNPELVVPTPFSEGQVTNFDVFEFLMKKPERIEIESFLGLPDSVWLNDDYTSMVYYYYIEELRDYNAVEINTITNKTTGFEWD